ncbi:hypothetical protein L1987_61358 [Smallanthus sonchifolius]|uniref:Uncharacterized protein n=1 Tax=Smallanthus sonchifolius TaxID=185202 RepID=A0ACB9DAM8_9ASTR|nr:hypothetical protein L1987_61358 [Smallanthus sonchifolius]
MDNINHVTCIYHTCDASDIPPCIYHTCDASDIPPYFSNFAVKVHLQAEKMRRRNDRMRWLMPPAVQLPLASQLQGIRLDSRPSSGELSSQLPQGGGEWAAVA